MYKKNKIQVINHNKKIADKNPKFLNEYEREVNGLKHFINKRLKLELELLNNDIETKGIENVKIEYPELSEIVDNYKNIKKEIEAWIK